jgi:AcrR family transcriptional regulator
MVVGMERRWPVAGGLGIESPRQSSHSKRWFNGALKYRLTKSTIVRIFPTMSKGEHTRMAILDVALAQASEAGFESLTIGSLAERAGLSKSGLFAHFGSREELQVAAIEAAAARFTETVFVPALKARRGLPRLRALFDNWLDWTARSGLTHGCPMQAAALEYDDRPGPVRDAIVEHFARLERELGRAVELAIGQGHMRADLDVKQFVFDMLGVIFAYYHSTRLLKVDEAGPRARAAFERLIAAASPAA